MRSENKKDIRCGKCMCWKSYEVCNHWKERRCENKDSPYYLHDTNADTQCPEFKRDKENEDILRKSIISWAEGYKK